MSKRNLGAVKQRLYIDLLFSCWLNSNLHPPGSMWLSGGVDRAKWYSFKATSGMLLEGAVRDDQGKAQGTMIIEVIAPKTTDEKGHWLSAKYILASDPHLRWWMAKGGGKSLAKKCDYHLCEVTTIDCPVSKRSPSIHMEKFRVLDQKQINAHVPGWAFGKGVGKSFLAYLKEKDMSPGKPEKEKELPWEESGEDEEEESEEEEEDSSGTAGLRSKLEKVRTEVGALEIGTLLLALLQLKAPEGERQDQAQ